MLDLKKTLTKLVQMFSVTRTTFTPVKGSAYSTYGGCYYEKYGRFVHLHLGLSGLTANAVNNVYYIPEAVRPSSSERIFAAGSCGDVTFASYAEVEGTGGKVSVVTPRTYCGIDMYWIL